MAASAMWTAAQTASMWAAAHVTWRSGARWLMLGMPLVAMALDTSCGGYAKSGGSVGGSGKGGGAGDDVGGSARGHWMERCPLGDAGDAVGGSDGDGPMSKARLTEGFGGRVFASCLQVWCPLYNVSSCLGCSGGIAGHLLGWL